MKARARHQYVSGAMLASLGIPSATEVGAFINPATSGGRSSGAGTSIYYGRAKAAFSDALDRPFELNKGSDERTALLKSITESEEGIGNPGRDFQSVAI